MRALALAPGYSKIGMVVPPASGDWLDGRHTAIVTSLADQAFGTSTNTLDPQYHYVAIQFSITFVSEVSAGEELVAEGQVVSLAEGRGSTEITVRGPEGRLVARATGLVLAVPK
jgi:uncharacterized protein (TIGR00369 family)